MVKLSPAAELGSALPPRLRKEEDAALRFRAFELLHEEAVAAGELAPAPRPLLHGFLSRLLGASSALLLGAVIGALSVAAVLFLLHQFGKYLA